MSGRSAIVLGTRLAVASQVNLMMAGVEEPRDSGNDGVGDLRAPPWCKAMLARWAEVSRCRHTGKSESLAGWPVSARRFVRVVQAAARTRLWVDSRVLATVRGF